VIRWETRGAVGLATIDRPERRNALSAAMCDDLRAHLEAEPDLRAVVITGAGTAFSAGADLDARFAASSGDTPDPASSGDTPDPASSGDTPDPASSGDTPDPGVKDEFRPAFERMLDAVEAYPAPVVAAINGPALGAGTQLIVVCDLRVAGREATFGIPATQLGVMLSPENVQRLALLVGHADARDLLLTGRRISVGEALRIGLVHRITDDPLAAALELADEIATLAPLTVAGHKRALNAVTEHLGYRRGPDDAALSELDALVRDAFASDDLKEGLAAFQAKRPPRFQGR
jgi:enoyl-CoA hydratase/carnithine racemase